MRRMVLHIIVAILAFVVGVTAATLLSGHSGHGKHNRRFHKRYVERIGHSERPARQYDCPYSRGMSELPAPPEVSDVPAPPPPPGVKSSKDGRVMVRRADGTWQAVEPGSVELKKY